MTDQVQHPVVYLALGSNLGDRAANLRAAVDALAPYVAVAHVSALYETEPAYVTDQPRFLNAALVGSTALEPHELLAALKNIERSMGRVAGERFGPRLIDLDILVYGELLLVTPELTLPHPRLAERPFVLVPLAEIAPDLVLPGLSTTVAALAAQAHGNGDIIARIGAF